MKKILSLLLTAALAVSLTGCSSAAPQTSSSASAGKSSGSSQSTSSAPDNSWNKVKSAGKMVLGLDKAFPPMGYVDTQTGKLVGFDIDLAK